MGTCISCERLKVVTKLPITVEVFAKRIYAATVKPDGKHKEIVSGAVAIDVGLDKLTLILHRDSLKTIAERVIKCRVELSLDGGVTWSPNPIGGEKVWPWAAFPIEFVVAAGQSLHPNTGEPVWQSSLYTVLPDPSNSQRMYRVVMTPLKDINTKIEVVCEKAGK